MTASQAGRPPVTLIVAQARNRVIGNRGQLPWRLPADLRRFRALTMGHHLIMGRTTFESIGRLLPGRTTVVLSRNSDTRIPGAVVARDLDQALDRAAGDPRPFVVGGGKLYESALPLAERLYMTQVHATIEGDTFFPQLATDRWRLVYDEWHAADDRNPYDYSFREFVRRS